MNDTFAVVVGDTRACVCMVSLSQVQKLADDHACSSTSWWYKPGSFSIQVGS